MELPTFLMESVAFVEPILWGLMVGNKVKGKIPKRCLQENKARHIFRKTNISCT